MVKTLKCNKLSTFFGWTENTSSLGRNVAVVYCWMGRNVARTNRAESLSHIEGWTYRRGTVGRPGVAGPTAFLLFHGKCSYQGFLSIICTILSPIFIFLLSVYIHRVMFFFFFMFPLYNFLLFRTPPFPLFSPSHFRLQPDTSTAPSPMEYASMGYASMGFTSMWCTSIQLLNFKILIYYCKEYTKMQVYIKEKCKIWIK